MIRRRRACCSDEDKSRAYAGLGRDRNELLAHLDSLVRLLRSRRLAGCIGSAGLSVPAELEAGQVYLGRRGVFGSQHAGMLELAHDFSFGEMSGFGELGDGFLQERDGTDDAVYLAFNGAGIGAVLDVGEGIREVPEGFVDPGVVGVAFLEGLDGGGSGQPGDAGAGRDRR